MTTEINKGSTEQNESTLYSCEPAKFLKRFWRLFRYYFFSFLFFILIPFVNGNSLNPILLIYLGLLLISLIMMSYFSYKWAFRKILNVTFANGIFKIEIIEMDVLKSYIVSGDDLRVSLKWEGGRPKNLVLRLYENRNKIVTVYSGGNEKEEYELENILFELKKYSS